MDNDVHSYVCRLCNQDRAAPTDRRKAIQKADHKDLILLVTGLDIEEDPPIAPHYICHPCKIRLNKGKAIKAKRCAGQQTWNIPHYPPASVPTELPCAEPPTPPVDKRKRLSDFVQSATPVGLANGFIDCGDGDVAIYMTLQPGTGKVLHKLTVNSDLSWSVEVHGVEGKCSSSALSVIPVHLHDFDIDLLFKCLLQLKVCEGITGCPMVVANCVASGKIELTDKKNEQKIAVVRGTSIFSVNCEVLVSEKESFCTHCRSPSFRNNMRAREAYLRNKKDSTANKTVPSSKVPLTTLGPDQLKERTKQMSNKIHNLQRKIRKMEDKIKKMLDQESVSVSEEQHDMLNKIVDAECRNIEEIFSEDSCQRILWQQQVKRAKVKGASGMRWHPTMIRWCVALFGKSPAAYRQLSQSGFLHLPHTSTLQSYMNFTQPRIGVNPDVIQLLVDELKINDMQDFQKNCCLVWDEIRVKSGLAYSESTGKIVGYCELDNINDELHKLSKFETDEIIPQTATHVIVFMVRTIHSSLNLPFIWYPCAGFKAEELWGAVWNATHILEDLGLRVRAWTCDGATPNRKFFKIHAQTGGAYRGVTYYTVNFFDEDRRIYFICDPPHLLKTARNNLENSHGHNNSRHLMRNEKEIKWPHIMSTVLEDKHNPLNRLYRIKEEHIHLSPQLRMRVRLAAQILSNSMSIAIMQRDRPEMEETAVFCKKLNDWFDCLNGRYMNQGVFTRNPLLAPYRDVDDHRFQFLMTDFLGWLNGWEDEIQDLPDLTQAEKSKLFISYQTADGLRIATVSFVELTKELLNDGASFLLAEKLNQDKLEMFFAKLRRSIGDGDNPSVNDVGHRILSLLVTGTQTVTPRNTNCTALDYVNTPQTFQLKRKKRQRRAPLAL